MSVNARYLAFETETHKHPKIRISAGEKFLSATPKFLITFLITQHSKLAWFVSPYFTNMKMISAKVSGKF